MAALRREPVAQAMPTVGRLVDDGLLASDGKTIRLTVQGRLLSNDVFQQFLGLDSTVDSDRESENCESALAAL